MDKDLIKGVATTISDTYSYIDSKNKSAYNLLIRKGMIKELSILGLIDAITMNDIFFKIDTEVEKLEKEENCER